MWSGTGIPSEYDVQSVHMCRPCTVTTSINLPNERSSFARLRGLAERFVETERLGDVTASRLVLILEELFTNVHKYSRGSRPAAAIEVRLTREGGTILIDFADDGGAFNPLGLPKPRIDRNLAERPVGGLGVHIVRSMAQESHYERTDGWNRLQLVCAIDS